MSKKFRCGRLFLSRDGRLKKLDLGSGGGTRTCEWTNDRMTFVDVHKQLLSVFSFTEEKQETSLYDFQHKPLDLNQFATLADYINKYGLNRNSTVVYLCTSETDIEMPISVVKQNTPVVRLSVVKEEVQSNPTTETHRAQSKAVSSVCLEYSFVHSSNEVMKNVRELIHQHPNDKVLAQLFENICLIHGYVFSIILPLQQQKHDDLASESEGKLHLNNLNNIYDIFERTKSLLHRNADHLRHLELFSTIGNSFFQFHNNVEILRNRWMKSVGSDSTRTSTVSRSSGSDNKPISRKNRQLALLKSSPGARMKFNLKLLKRLWNHLHLLLRSTKTRRVSSFRKLIVKEIDKVTVLQSTLDLSDQRSIVEGRKGLLELKSQLNQQYKDFEAEPCKIEAHTSLLAFRPLTSKVIRCTLEAIDRHETRVAEWQGVNHSKS